MGYTKASRGVAILLHRILPLAVSRVEDDTYGHDSALQGMLERQTYHFISVSVPPQLLFSTLDTL